MLILKNIFFFFFFFFFLIFNLFSLFFFNLKGALLSNVFQDPEDDLYEPFDEEEREKRAQKGNYENKIKSCCIHGDMRGAYRGAEDMERAGLVPDALTYRTLIRGWSQLGDMQRANDVFR